jgi:biopolymer transport protein ExbD/biopolymer transport protein TolR
MAGHRKSSSKKQPDPTPEINVTPLVDVVLVLLIIFMVITPAIADGEQVALPDIVEVDKKKNDTEPVDLTYALHGVVLLQKEPIAQADLEPRLVALFHENTERKIMIKADVALPYASVREAFALVQRVGFRGIQLKVTQRKQPGA